MVVFSNHGGANNGDVDCGGVGDMVPTIKQMTITITNQTNDNNNNKSNK